MIIIIICKRCSYEASDEDIYCMNCGNKLEEEVEVVVKEEKIIGPRSKKTAILLTIFLGLVGINNYYLGQKTSFYIKLAINLITFGLFIIVTWIWSLVELIIIIVKKDYIDGYGNKLVK